MKVAVIDHNLGCLEVYRDFLEENEINPDLYDSFIDFVQDDKGQYKLVILAHSIPPLDWFEMYHTIKGQPFVIVVTTSDMSYYKSEFNSTIYATLEKIKTCERAYYCRKDDYKTLKKYLDIEKLANKLVDILV